jgi:threonine/homoserine/homoserine lactone efflux protein
MEVNILLSGLAIGFSIAAPVGPIGVLCIRRTLAEGRTAGLLTGMGAATADGLFGSVAAFGLSVISNFLIGQQFWFRLLGGAFLCYLGVRTFLSTPATQAALAGGRGLLSAYISTLFLTLTNPVTILFFAAVFVTVAASGATLNAGTAILLVVGVFMGSAAWWLFLSVTVSVARSWFTPRLMRWVNRLSGLVIVGFGIVALLSLHS